MNVIKRALSYIKSSRQNILDGGINSVPTPFSRFRDDFVGVQKGKFYLITAQTKAAKTQFTSYVFIYNTLLYAYHNPDKLKLKVFYFPLEETQELVVLRFMSYLLYSLSNGKYSISPQELLSANNVPLDENIISLLESNEYQEYLNFFNECIVFSSTTNVTGIYKEVRQYAQSRGETHYVKVPITNDYGLIEEVDKFDHFTPHDDKELIMFLVDHVGELNLERGFTKKENIDKLGDYAIELRNRYNVTSVLVQQQLVNENTDNFKLDKLRPTITNLQDTKYLAQKANLVLGVFSPLNYGLDSYMGYDIKSFKDSIRFLEVLAGRDGASRGITALYFNGACSYFKQLPKPDDPQINQWYSYFKQKREEYSFFIYKYIKKFING